MNNITNIDQTSNTPISHQSVDTKRAKIVDLVDKICRNSYEFHVNKNGRKTKQTIIKIFNDSQYNDLIPKIVSKVYWNTNKDLTHIFLSIAADPKHAIVRQKLLQFIDCNTFFDRYVYFTILEILTRDQPPESILPLIKKGKTSGWFRENKEQCNELLVLPLIKQDKASHLEVLINAGAIKDFQLNHLFSKAAPRCMSLYLKIHPDLDQKEIDRALEFTLSAYAYFEHSKQVFAKENYMHMIKLLLANGASPLPLKQVNSWEDELIYKTNEIKLALIKEFMWLKDLASISNKNKIKEILEWSNKHQLLHWLTFYRNPKEWIRTHEGIAKELFNFLLLHDSCDYKDASSFLKICVELGIIDLKMDGRNHLFQAIDKGNHGLVRALIEAGVCPNISNKEDKTPLDLAISRLDEKMADILISSGSKIDEEKHFHKLLNEFETVMQANDLSKLTKHLHMLEVLISHIRDLSVETTAKQTVLHLLIEAAQIAKTDPHAYPLAKSLFRKVVQRKDASKILDKVNHQNKIPLELAQFEQVFLLLQAGAHPFLPISRGKEIDSLVAIYAGLKGLKTTQDLPDTLFPPKGSSPLERLISQMDEKNLALFLGDAIILKQKMKSDPQDEREGSQGAKSLQFVISLLELILNETSLQLSGEERNQLQKGVLNLQAAIAIKRLMTVFAKGGEKRKRKIIDYLCPQIQNWILGLSQGESLLMPTGWIGYGIGHFMLCEFIKLQNGCFRINVYNTGVVNKHQNPQIDGSKIKISPCMSFEDISFDEIEQTDFLRALLELDTVIPNSKKDKYSPNDLFEAIFKRFESKKALPDSDEIDLKISVQKSGTCSMRAPIAFLHKFLGSAMHKKVFLEARIRLLEICASLGKDHSKLLESVKDLLQFAEENLGRKILKWEEKAPELTLRSYTRLLDLKSKLKFDEISPDFTRSFHIPQNPKIMKTDPLSQAIFYHKLNSTRLSSFLNKIPNDKPEMTKIPHHCDYKDPSSAINTLQELYKYCTTACIPYTRTQQTFITDYLTSSIFNMPMPKSGMDAWQAMTETEIDKANSLIVNLHQLLTGGLLLDGKARSDRLVALNKLFAIAWKLGCMKEKKLAYFGVDRSHLIVLQNSLFNLPSSPEVQEQLSQIIDFYQKSHPSPNDRSRTLFDYSQCKESPHFKHFNANTGEKQYIDELIKKIPDEEIATMMGPYQKSGTPDGVKPRKEEWIRAAIWSKNIDVISQKAEIGQQDLTTFVQLRDLALTTCLAPTAYYLQQIFRSVKSDTIPNLAKMLLSEPVLYQADNDSKISFKIGFNTCLTNPFSPMMGVSKSIELQEFFQKSFDEKGIKLSNIGRLGDLFESKEEPSQQNEAHIKGHKHLEYYEISLRKNLRLHMLLKYFDLHIDDLMYLENQNYFLVNLYSQGVLRETLIKDHAYASSLVKLLNHGIDEFKIRLSKHKINSSDQNNTHTMEKVASGLFFCLFNKFLIIDFVEHTCAKNPFKQSCNQLREHHRNELKRWLQTPPPYPWLETDEIRSMARLTLLASYNQTEWNDPSTAAEIAYHRARQVYEGLDEHMEINKDSAFQTQVVKHSFSKNARNFTKLMEDIKIRCRICSSVLEAYGIKPPQNVIWKGNYPHLSSKFDGRLYEINIPDGTVLCNSTQLGKPIGLYEDSTYRDLFDETRLINMTKETGSDDQIIYRGTHPDSKIEYTILMKGLKISKSRIFRMVDDVEYEFHPWTKVFEKPLKLDSRKHFWFCTNPNTFDIAIEDTESGNIVAHLNRDTLVSLKDIKGFYEIVDVAVTPEWKALAALDKPSNVTVFKCLDKDPDDDEQPNHIVYFKRLCDRSGVQLAFEEVQKEIKNQNVKETVAVLAWKDNPHYFIDTNQTVIGIKTNPPLVLRDRYGKQKALLPIRCMASYAKSTKSMYKEDFYHFELIDIDTEGKLIPSTPLQQLLISYRMLSQCDYAEAMQMLKNVRKHQRYTQEELQLLGWIFKQGKESEDYNPHAQAVRLYAAWMVHCNMRMYPEEINCADENTDNKKKDATTQSYYQPEYWKRFWKNEKMTRNNTSNSHSEKKELTCSEQVVDAYVSYCQASAHVSPVMRLDNVVESSSKYHKFLSHTLNPLQELDWLISLQNQSPSFFVKERINQLKGKKEGKSVYMSVATDRKTTVDLSNIDIKKWVLDDRPAISMDKLLSKLSRLRPGNTLRQYYRELYRFARYGTQEDKRKILFFLQDMQFEKDASNQTFRAILHALCTAQSSSSRLSGSNDTHNILLNDLQKYETETLSSMESFNRDIEQYSVQLNQENAASLDENVTTFEANLIPSLPIKSTQKLSLSLSQDNDRAEFNTTVFSDCFNEIKDTKSHKAFWNLSDNAKKDEFVTKRHGDVHIGYQAGCAENDKKTRYRLKDGNDLNKLSEVINKTIDKETLIVNALKIEIEYLSIQLPANPNEKMLADLQRLGHKIIPCSFDTLVNLFVKGDPQAYHAYLPCLTCNEVQILHNKMGEYLMNATDLQLYQKTLKLVEKAIRQQDKIKNASKNDKLQNTIDRTKHKLEETLHLCGEALSAARTYTPQDWPAFIVFEYFSGFNLRRQQTDDMIALLSKDNAGGYRSTILQRIMSAGKTVVYGTLLTFLKADGYHLAMLFPPASLFETNAQDMLNRSQTYFGQKGHPIKFRRGPQYFSLDYLRNLRSLLVNAIRNREYVMMTAESLQSMQNTYIDSIHKLAKLKEAKNLLGDKISQSQKNYYDNQIQSIEECKQELKEILKLLRERGAATFDEVDLTGNPRKELNFPTDEIDHLDPLGVELVLKLFQYAATDPEVKSLGLNLHKNTQARLLTNEYDKIKKILAGKIIDHILCESRLREKLCLPNNFNDQDKEELINYVSFKDRNLPEWVLTLSKSALLHEQESAERLALIKQQLVEWLPECWKRTADEHYGRSKEFPHIEVAKPYIAANIPNERAEISDRWETVNKTCQLYIAKGLDIAQTKQLIMNLCQKALSERTRQGGLINLEDTETAKLFTSAFRNEKGKPLDLFSISLDVNDDIKLIRDQLRNGSDVSIRFILEYLQDEVFPQHEIFTEQISNNHQNASAGLKSIQGYSGTLENPYIFHHSIVSKQDGIIPDISSNGRVIDVLLESNRQVHKIDAENHNLIKIMEDILDKKNAIERNRFHALIDLGVLFKGYSNFSIACSLLAYFSSKTDSPIKGVLFYDNRTNELAFLKKGSAKPVRLPATDQETIRSVTGLKQEELFTFYDHFHTTGSNILQTDDAAAIATFSESVTMRDILQGVMRMRKLLETQHVEFAVPNSIIHYLEERLGTKIACPSIDELLMYGELNGFELEKQDNIRVSFQKIYDHVASFVRHVMYQTKDTDKEIALFNISKYLFMRSTKENLFKKYGMHHPNEDTAKILEMLKNTLCAPLEKESGLIALDQFNVMKTILDVIINYAKARLPNELPSTDKNDPLKSDTVEHLQEAEKQNETDRQQEQAQLLFDEQVLNMTGNDKAADENAWPLVYGLNVVDLRCRDYPASNELTPVVWRLSDVIKSHSTWSSFAQCFDWGIQVTDNFVKTRKYHEDFFVRSAKKPHQMLLIKEAAAKSYRIIFLSIHEASSFKEVLDNKAKGHKTIWLIEPDGNVIAGDKDALDTHDEMLQNVLVQTQLISGYTHTLSELSWEKPIRRVLVNRKRDFRDLLEIVILNKAQRQKYRGSNLESILNEYDRQDSRSAGESSIHSRNAAIGATLGYIGPVINELKNISREALVPNPDLVKQSWETLIPLLKLKETAKIAELDAVLINLIAGIESYPELIDQNFKAKLVELLEYNLNLSPKIIDRLAPLYVLMCKIDSTLARLICRECIYSLEAASRNTGMNEEMYAKTELIFRLIQSLENSQDKFDIEKWWKLWMDRFFIGSNFEPLLTRLLAVQGSSEDMQLENCGRILAEQWLDSSDMYLSNKINALCSANSTFNELKEDLKKAKRLLFDSQQKFLIKPLQKNYIDVLATRACQNINGSPMFSDYSDDPAPEAALIIQLLKECGIPYALEQALMLEHRFSEPID